MIFLTKSLRAASDNAGKGRKFKELPWYHRWNFWLSRLNWFSYDYWFRYRPLKKKVKRLEEELWGKTTPGTEKEAAE